MLFEKLHVDLKPPTTQHLIPAILFIRAFSAYRAAAMVALSMPGDAYPMYRSCLELAGYAHLIAKNEELSKVWIKRDDSEETIKLVRKTFTHTAIRYSIKNADATLADVYHTLYERCIQFGAHPNEKGTLTSIIRESLKTNSIQVKILPGEGILLQSSLRVCVQIGLCALRIFNLILPKQFESADAPTKIREMSQGF